MNAFKIVFLIATISENEAMQQSLNQGSSSAPNTLIGAIAKKLPSGFGLASCDADGNEIVTWKELYDTLSGYQIPNLDTGVIKKLVTDFNVDGDKEGADAGLDRAEFAKMVAMLKKKSANALVPKDPNAFDTGCSMEDDKGLSYRGLVSTTISGRKCQNWSAEKPHTIGIPADGENGLGNHAFCRNPDESEEQPWCFTMDPSEDHAKEKCEVPKCPELERDFAEEADALGVEIANHLKCHCVDQHYGSYTTTADTAIPLTLLAKAKKQFGSENVELAKKKCNCRPGQIAVLQRH
jgi:hypothetical protein